MFTARGKNWVWLGLKLGLNWRQRSHTRSHLILHPVPPVIAIDIEDVTPSHHSCVRSEAMKLAETKDYEVAIFSSRARNQKVSGTASLKNLEKRRQAKEELFAKVGYSISLARIQRHHMCVFPTSEAQAPIHAKPC